MHTKTVMAKRDISEGLRGMDKQSQPVLTGTVAQEVCTPNNSEKSDTCIGIKSNEYDSKKVKGINGIHGQGCFCQFCDKMPVKKVTINILIPLLQTGLEVNKGMESMRIIDTAYQGFSTGHLFSVWVGAENLSLLPANT